MTDLPVAFTLVSKNVHILDQLWKLKESFAEEEKETTGLIWRCKNSETIKVLLRIGKKFPKPLDLTKVVYVLAMCNGVTKFE